MQPNIKEILAKSRKTNPADFFIKTHYLFCRKFGWIPVEEFKKLPMPMVLNFMECITEEIKEEQKAVKQRGKIGVKK